MIALLAWNPLAVETQQVNVVLVNYTAWTKGLEAVIYAAV